MSKSPAHGDGFSADEDEFFDAVELLDNTSSHHDTLSSGVEDDGGAGSNHVALNIDVGGVDADTTTLKNDECETGAAAATNPTAYPVNLDSSLSLCQSVTSINFPLLDSKIQVKPHHHTSMDNYVEVESGHAVDVLTKSNDEGEKDSATPTKPTLTKSLTPINLHSSPCRGQNVYNIESPLEALYSIGTQEGKKLPPSLSPTRTSSVMESDDDSLRGIRLPPLIESEKIANQDAGQLHVNWRANSNSDSDSDSSVSIEEKYQIINKDTGKVHDVRQVMKDIHVSGSSDALDTDYSLLPTRGQLEHQLSRRISWSNPRDSDDSGSHASSMRRFHWSNSKDSDDSGTIPSTVDSGVAKKEKTSEPKRGGMKFPKMPKASSKMAESVLKGMAGLKTSRSQINRKRTSSADMVPSNAVYVRSSSRPTQTRSGSSGTVGHSHDIHNDSSFNPMLLIKTIPNAHEGPAWCASFSQNGRFLATGGGDGNVCIWVVSPKSKVMHPDGVQIHLEDGADTDILSGEHSEKKECVTKEDDNNNPSSPAPPLHFIGTGPSLATNLEILSTDPIRRFKDHTNHVIDLSWSRTNFLLSASLDSSVRLYHYSKPVCLHCFQHATYVASVAFHPKEDRYFISGGVDKKLRLWDITDGRVKEWAQAPDAITATRFTPDGKYAVAGLFHGQVYFYDATSLKYYTQVACKNRSGKYSKGAKVTGISFVREERDDWPEVKQKFVSESAEADDNHASLSESLSRRILALRGSPSNTESLRFTERMLVSTNDSRVRLFGLNDFCLVRKYKGHINCSMQIRARLSESGSHLACGSESGHVFIWVTLDKKKLKKNNANVSVYSTHNKARSSDNFEASRAHLPIVTDTVFFRSKSVKEALLSSEHVFPFALGMDRVDDDMSSAAILTLDYDGTMRVFLRKSCIDNLLDAATPRGNTNEAH
jgi:WD40 repeat protein